MKMKYIIYTLLFFCNLSRCESTEVNPYDTVNLLPAFDFGYYTNAFDIEKLFSQNDIKVVVEVGSWLGGGSTKHFAQLLQNKNGSLYAVDTWLGSSSQQLGNVHYQPQLHCAYDQFLSNMIHWGFQHIVIPFRMTSLEASEYLKSLKSDLVYIDAEHTTEAVLQDLKAWYPFVCESGILCGDDWTWPTVREAVEQFACDEGLLIENSYNFWRLKKKPKI